MYVLAGPISLAIYAQLKVGTDDPNSSFCQVDIVVLINTKLTNYIRCEASTSQQLGNEAVHPEGETAVLGCMSPFVMNTSNVIK